MGHRWALHSQAKQETRFKNNCRGIWSNVEVLIVGMRWASGIQYINNTAEPELFISWHDITEISSTGHPVLESFTEKWMCLPIWRFLGTLYDPNFWKSQKDSLLVPLETGSPGGDLAHSCITERKPPWGHSPHEGNGWSQRRDLKLSDDMKSPDLTLNCQTSRLNKPKEDFLFSLKFPFVKNKMKLPKIYLKFHYSGFHNLMVHLTEL